MLLLSAAELTRVQCSDQLNAWNHDGTVKLITAFSRDQGHKVYVQDRLVAEGALVWELIAAGAHVYVCGDASSMAGQVEVALKGVAVTHGGLDALQAHAWLEALSACKRYQRDVWF